jgi:hypothetical protein
LIKIILFLLVIAFIHARLELQIEGKKAGWALRLPTWRIDNRFTEFLIGKEITGYHFYLLLMFLILFHSPYLFIPFTLKTEVTLLGLFCWYWIAEDWFWFLENSMYGLRNFKPGRIFWHKRWIYFLPVSYAWGMILGTILLMIGGLLNV